MNPNRALLTSVGLLMAADIGDRQYGSATQPARQPNAKRLAAEKKRRKLEKRRSRK